MKAKLNQGDESITELTGVFFGNMDHLQWASDWLLEPRDQDHNYKQ